jgi:hypothetical protein
VTRASDTARILSGGVVINEDSNDVDLRVESNGNANMLFVDGGNDSVGISNSAPPSLLTLGDGTSNITDYDLAAANSGQDAIFINSSDETSAASAKGNSIGFGAVDGHTNRHASICAVQTGTDRDVVGLAFHTHSSATQSDDMKESVRIHGSGDVSFNITHNPVGDSGNVSGSGQYFNANSYTAFSRNGNIVSYFNRTYSDGTIISFRQDATDEGTISVSGSTVSYNGGHLSRWSRLLNNSKDTTIVKGTVMTNLDEMVEWKHEKELWTKDDELPDGVSVGDVKKDAYTEDNEQLNKMAVSSVEGDVNVAGVFVNWDEDDDYNDMNVAMTGDMVIKIAKGTTVSRGDLLMSAGDGTAKPQGDDIVKSKTIAKVTSTNVSHTYDDGTYLVPCVLMAC